MQTMMLDDVFCALLIIENTLFTYQLVLIKNIFFNLLLRSINKLYYVPILYIGSSYVPILL